MNSENASTAFQRLQDWYLSNRDGDWEHQYGLTLETLDNPGWRLTIDLDDTIQENEDFAPIDTRDDSRFEWMSLKKDGTKLQGACGPNQLGEMLDVVSRWLRPRPR